MSLALLLLAACNQPPSDREIAELLKKRPETYDKKLFFISDITKTNGVQKDNVYIAYIKYNYVAKMSFSAWLLKVVAEGKDARFEAIFAFPPGVPLQTFPAGERFPHKEVLTLVKTDRGWRLEGRESE